MKEFNGKVSNCLEHSNRCNFNCCCHSNPNLNEPIIPQSSILLSPRELEGKERIEHLIITKYNYFNGTLAFCDPEKIDQSKCDPYLNYKPLDCQSYPFFPRIIDDNLVLYKDPRCPLGEKNYLELKEIYSQVLSLWVEAIKDPAVKLWVNQVEIPSYRLYPHQK